MVQIIQNPYRPQPNMGDTFKAGISSLAAPFLDSITPEIKRQHLLTMQQALQDAQHLADIKRNVEGSIGPNGEIANPQAMGIGAALGAANPRAVGQGQLVYNANKYGAMDPRTTNAAAGAGEAYGSTGQGTREAEQMRANTQIRGAQIQADAQVRQAGLEPVQVQDANGNLGWSTKADVATGVAEKAGFHPVLTTEFLKARAADSALRRSQGGAPANVAGAPGQVAGTGAPGGVQPDLAFGGLPTDIAKDLGGYSQPQTFIDYANRRVFVSKDGGKTGMDTATGQNVPLPPGAIPQNDQTAGAEVRGVLTGQQANEPDPFENLDPRTSNLAIRSQKVMGFPAFLSREANIATGLFNGPEFAPERQRATQNIGVTNQVVMDAAHISPTFPKFEQQRLMQLLPSTGALFGNANTESEKAPVLADMFKRDRARLKEMVKSVDPATRARAQEALAANTKALSEILEGAQPYTQGQGVPGAPAQGGIPVGTPSQADQPTQQPAAAPQAQEQPPMAGAEKAPDGYWYVQKNGQFFRVDQ